MMNLKQRKGWYVAVATLGMLPFLGVVSCGTAAYIERGGAKGPRT